MGLLCSAACLVVSCNKKIIEPDPPYTGEEEEENTQKPEPPEHVDPEDTSVSFVISLPDNMTENNNILITYFIENHSLYSMKGKEPTNCLVNIV